MEYRTLGKSDLNVSTICLGTMQFGWTADKPATFRILSEYCERGGNFLDTADVYSSWLDDNPGGVAENWIGDWLAESEIKREDIIIGTKAGLRMWEGEDGAGLGRKHIVEAVEQSLSRLKIDVIDLYQAHWPDPNVPIDETLRAFDDLVQQGKVRSIGCSNFDTELLQLSLDISGEMNISRIESLQPHYNMMRRFNFEGSLMDLCLKENVGVIPYSSLARGFLTGKYKRGEPIPEKAQASPSLSPFFTEEGFDVIEALHKVAFNHETTVASVAIAWLLANPAITSTIIGASSVDQLIDIFGTGGFSLSEEEKSGLDHVSNWTLEDKISNDGLKGVLKKSL